MMIRVQVMCLNLRDVIALPLKEILSQDLRVRRI
jgi:hypothetical protein